MYLHHLLWLKEITLLEAENLPEPIAHLPWSKIKSSSANSSFPKTKHLLKVTHLREKHVVTDNLSNAPLRTPSGPNPCIYPPLLRSPASPGEDWKPHVSPRTHPAINMFAEVAGRTIYPTSSLLVFFGSNNSVYVHPEGLVHQGGYLVGNWRMLERK